ncbi:hypothetical protein AQUCO_02200300v1 [Aquilegia coerulea]|uniref:Uncharacterized protein n=1 Tax=Aquilegia coerulea TaxID=218851 RepID=A0A2G5DE14_AQUCA|nr:hypothetical protein AQUCO_02200300v1 [Aquilegia coerulea]
MSFSGGGRGGGGRGRGRGRGSVVPPPSSYSSSSPSTSSSTAAASATILSCEVEEKLILETPTPTPTPPASSKAARFPSRPGLGTAGTKCVVRANHFLVKLKEKDLHHYDVSITPEVISRGFNRAVMKELVLQYRQSHMGGLQPVYDGRKGLFTAGPLPFASKEFVINLGEKEEKASSRREREFKVAIKLAGRTDLHHLQQFLSGQQRDAPQETIQVLDIVLREKPSNDYTVVGRSFFSIKLGQKSEVGDGLECWRGYYQSLRPTQMGMSLNIDVAATAFYEAIPVVDYICKFLNLRDPSRPLTDIDRIKVKKAVRGLRVELTHRKDGKRHKILGISSQPLNQLMFNTDEKRLSVEQYFLDKYRIRLRCTHWPALQAGSDSKPTYLPMEVCNIVEGQKYSKKLNERQVTAILKASCKRPEERERSIERMAWHNDYNNDKFAKEFGISVDSRLTTISSGRVLQPPMLKYHDTGKDVRIQPRVGQWNMINSKMIDGATINHWTCVNFSSRSPLDIAFRFSDRLVSMCASKGMKFNTKPLVPIRSARSDQIESALVELHTQSQGKLQLLIIVLPDFSGSYGTIKRICETELGIISQCCQPKQAQKLSNQYLENVALKINVKAGGRNTVLLDALLRKIPMVSDNPTIIFGADVTHPHPGEDSSPSIAAVVASMDWPEVTKYRGLVSAQSHRQELIQDLHKVVQDPQKGAVHGGMIRELLIHFRRSTGLKPHRIIFYRDGVSEGQFSQVLLYELDAIRKKRHHTRLFPAEHGNRNTTDKSGNILPGTVIDTHICHPSEFDFYLCSHAGIQGTSRPTHYHVLWDENRFTSDNMQTLTNNLCYTYARCTRSVSVVPPAYYAHLAAFRARYYIEGNVSNSHTSPATRGLNAQIRPLPTIKDNVKDVMFYC